MTSYTPIIRQLRTILLLTQTEAQIARTRVLQARTDAVRGELTQNADDAEQRTQLIVNELRALGGVPDVVSPLVGRLTAVLKSSVEQAAPFDEALLGDLALEQQLQGRARYLKVLAEAVDRASTRGLAERLEAAHTETIEWITTVLAEEALGGPAALRATPFQRISGGLTQVVSLPARVAVGQLNRVVERVRHTAGRATDSVEELADRAAVVGRDAKEVLTSGRDAALERAEAVARRDGASGTAGTVHDVRRELGSLNESELPVKGYDGLGTQDAIKGIKELRTSDDIRAIVRYEEAHKARSGVVSAAQTRLAAVAKEVAGVN